VSYEPTLAALAGRRLFGERIRQLRAEQGLSQEALALGAGLDRSFLADIESGRHSFALDRLFDLAVALDVSPRELLLDDVE
jgi:transcriptional regulator with XRE-family HTH domain